jgi:hypothetical protein
MAITRTVTTLLLAAGIAFGQSVSEQSDGQPTVASATSVASASASVGQQSDGQVTVATSHISSYASAAPVSGTETALFSSLAITEASHTETIQVPVNTESGPLSFSSLAITEASHTETIPVPVPVSKLSQASGPSAPAVTTPVAPTNTATGPYVPSSGFTSTVITEASHTETVPIPIVSYATSGYSFSSLAITEASHTETVPVPVGPVTYSASSSKYVAPSASSSQYVAPVASGSAAAGGSSNSTASSYTTPSPAAYTGGAVAVKPVAALVGAAMFLRALI